MIIPIHLDLFSIPIFIIGIYVLIKYRVISNKLYLSYGENSKMSNDAIFRESPVEIRFRKFLKGLTIFAGFMIIISSILLSFGPILIGEAAYGMGGAYPHAFKWGVQ